MDFRREGWNLVVGYTNEDINNAKELFIIFFLIGAFTYGIYIFIRNI